jgi:tricorn protease
MLIVITAAVRSEQSTVPMLTVTPPLLIGAVGEVALSRSHIAFSYMGDLWAIGREGGNAARLTNTPDAEESFPVYSPDGQWLAFARATGDTDVYVMSSRGGDARRLTYFPKPDTPVGWTPDGRDVLLASGRDGDGSSRLYRIPRDGVFETALPLPTGFQASYSPDTRRVAYLPKSYPLNALDSWRFYRGGRMSPLWIVDLASGRLDRVTTEEANARYPMWVGSHVYFTSDRTGTFNLYDFNTTTRQMRALTTFTSVGIDGAAATGDAIAFVRGGRIYLHDIAAATEREVPVSLVIEVPELAPREVAISRWIESLEWADDDRVIVGGRGDVVSVDPSTGESTAITASSESAERFPTLSPDGRRLAYFSDRSGEYALHVRDVATGHVSELAIERRPSFYRELTWAPDSKRLAFSDIRLSLWLIDVDTKNVVTVDTSRYIAQGEFQPSWSPDGRYLAYALADPHGTRAAVIVDTATHTRHQVTDGLTTVQSPVFDSTGRYLYLTSSANARAAAASDTGWGLLSSELARPLVRRTMHVAVLHENDVAPWHPLTNRPRTAPSPMSEIDLTHLSRRIVTVPVGARDFETLEAGGDGRLVLSVLEWPTTPAAADQVRRLYRFDPSAPTRLEKLADDVSDWSLSRDGTGVVTRDARGDYWVSRAGGAAVRVALERVVVRVDPTQEWRQMYREAWRQMRDTFYDQNHHGQDLAALEARYQPMLASVTRRASLNRLFLRMLGQVSVSHLQVGGGDGPSPPQSAPVGDVGADFTLENGRYRISKIVRSPHFSTVAGLLTAPLDQPGVDVREGDYLIAVDGQPVDGSRNVYSSFVGKVNQPVAFTVASGPDGRNARTYTVVPSAGTGALRNEDRAEANRRLVDRLSDGRLAYAYIGSHNFGGFDALNRALIGQQDREGLVIDQRNNGGGITADAVIEALNRQRIYDYAYRYGDGFATPANTFAGPKVLIINEQNFSAAETFALMFKLTKTGVLVGQRTGGGGIGAALYQPRLVDGGRIGIPNRAAYESSKSWGIENHGVAPDVGVELLPTGWKEGDDPQLERAVRVAMQALERTSKTSKRKQPPYPVHP